MSIEDVKRKYELSDLEVADAYNWYFRTNLAAPLPNKLADYAADAVEEMLLSHGRDRQARPRLRRF